MHRISFVVKRSARASQELDNTQRGRIVGIEALCQTARELAP